MRKRVWFWIWLGWGCSECRVEVCPIWCHSCFQVSLLRVKGIFSTVPPAHLDNLYLAVTFVLLAVAILCVWRQGACPLPVCEAATGVHLREMMIEPGPGPGKLEEEDTSSSTVVTVLHFPLTSAWCWYDCWAQPRSTITTCTFYFIHVAHWNLIDILHWLGVAT